MRTYKIEFLDYARDDLTEIRDHSFALFGERSGQKLINKILKAIKILELFPYSGTLIEEYELKLQGYRTKFVDDIVVVYRIIEDVIYIYHIANSRTEYKTLF